MPGAAASSAGGAGPGLPPPQRRHACTVAAAAAAVRSPLGSGRPAQPPLPQGSRTPWTPLGTIIETNQPRWSVLRVWTLCPIRSSAKLEI